MEQKQPLDLSTLSWQMEQTGSPSPPTKQATGQYNSLMQVITTLQDDMSTAFLTIQHQQDQASWTNAITRQHIIHQPKLHYKHL
jgi:hypothetical protein